MRAATLEEQANAFNKRFRYRPYRGGAGPTPRQTSNLNNLLARAAAAEGLHVERCSEKAQYEKQGEDAPYDYDAQCVRVGRRVVSFDRWGYCAFGHSCRSGSVDQADLFTAVRYLAGKLRGNS